MYVSEVILGGGGMRKRVIREIMADDATRPRIGLALGSVGIKSFSALPVIEFFKQFGIPVDMVAAVGGGALLAGLWGSGYNLNEMQTVFSKAVDRRFFTDVNYRAVMDLAQIPKGKFSAQSGLLRPHGLRRVYRRIFSRQRVEDLKPKTVIATTDLLTGRRVAIESGDLAEAVYAGGAYYPFMPPLPRNGDMLVDGSFSSPLPLMECVKQSMDIIVGVYFDDACNPEPEGFLECHSNASKIYRKALLTSQMPLSIDMHHYEIIVLNINFNASLEMWEVERLPEILHGGKLAVQEKGAQILEAIKGFSAFNHRERKATYQLCSKPGDKIDEASDEIEEPAPSEKKSASPEKEDQKTPPDLRVDDEPLKGLGD
jgi:NTE family protein